MMKKLALSISIVSSAVAFGAPLDAPTVHTLSNVIARDVLDAALAYATSHEAPGGAIAIVDSGGALVAFARLDGSFPAASDVSIGKARTAARFRKPTRVFEDTVNQGRISMTTVPAVTGFTPLQGGVPLVIGGDVVGAIGVSGAASAAQDDEIAQAAADALAARDQEGRPQ
jgi:glc operon protein GlcG